MFDVKKEKLSKCGYVGICLCVIGLIIGLFTRTNNVAQGISLIVGWIGIGIATTAGFRKITQRLSRGAKIFILIIASVGVLLGICSGISRLLSALG